MKSFGARFRMSVGMTVMLAVVTGFSLSSFAAQDVDNSASNENNSFPAAQQMTGSLTGTGGFMINGNAAQSGATVLSGSLISTKSEGNATIDLGPLGRIDLRPNTSVMVQFSPGLVQLASQCRQVRIEVTRGQINVTQPATGALNAGESDVFNGPVKLNTNGGADLVADCAQTVHTGSNKKYIGPGVVGVLAMIGTAAGIALGVQSGDNKPATPQISPVVP